MKIKKMELAQKINKLKSVVPKQTPTPVLQGILVQDGYLIASNIEMTVKAKIEGADGEAFIIPAKAFDLINNLPDGEIEVVSGKGNTIKISAAKIKNTYQTMEPDIFPLPAIPEGDNNITVESEKLLESMKRVSYAVSAKGADARMASLCMQATKGILNFVGLDGHVMAWDKMDYPGEFELLIPKSTVDKLLSIGLSGEILISHNAQSAVFASKDYEIYTRLTEGNYFQYQAMFRELPFNTTISKTELEDAMLRAKMCTEEKKPIRWDIDGTSIDINIRDATTDYHEVISLQKEMPEKMAIGFDARLVIQTLKAFDSQDVRLQLGSPKLPMVVETEESSFRALVLPVLIQ